MRVLLIGSGGREHALAEKLLTSPALEELFWLPGNAALEGRVSKVTDIHPNDGPSITTWARRVAIDLAVIGPEMPLLAGVSDCLEEVGIPCFAPSRAAAQIEGSKAFAKELMVQAGVPTARFRTVANAEEALAVVEEWGAPLVIKADGLAGGKGVVVALGRETALQGARDLQGPGLVEEFLTGREVSFMVLAQGERFVPLVPSQDYKRIGDGGTGPNTGGMGAVASFQLLDEAQQRFICTQVIAPVLKELSKAGTPFKGILYAGMMLTPLGPKVLEFNARLGDPETQAILALWEDDLLEVVTKVARGGLPEQLTWRYAQSLCLVLASQGYPGEYATGFPIRGLEGAAQGVSVYHAGTALAEDVVTAGGRVVALATQAESLAKARAKVYQAAGEIEFQGKYYRKDIGKLPTI
jgi:phosphoribosylamine--glycine ligase